MLRAALRATPLIVTATPRSKTERRLSPISYISEFSTCISPALFLAVFSLLLCSRRFLDRCSLQTPVACHTFTIFTSTAHYNVPTLQRSHLVANSVQTFASSLHTRMVSEFPSSIPFQPRSDCFSTPPNLVSCTCAFAAFLSHNFLESVRVLDNHQLRCSHDSRSAPWLTSRQGGRGDVESCLIHTHNLDVSC